MRLTVERMSYGTGAVAHAEDGRVVFVTGACPGDVVEAAVDKDGKRAIEAHVTEVLEPGPDRVRPRCPYAGICGGCPWAQLDYGAQLAAKRANVVDAFKRIGKLDAGRVEGLVRECMAPGDPWGYRNKVELAAAEVRGKTVLGLHAARGGGVVKADECLLFDPSHKKLLKHAAGALSYLANSHGLVLDRVGLRGSRRTKEAEVAIWTPTGPFPRAQAVKMLEQGAKVTSIVRPMLKRDRDAMKARKVARVERLDGIGAWDERILDEEMRVSAPSFFQVNTKGADALVSTVLEALEPTEDDVAMDLYSGAGTFTLPLARRCAWVDAVESYGPAVRDLRKNLERANLTNADAVGGDAGREFPDDADPDIVVVDPPRAGLAEEVVRLLSETPARAVAYVSCDPATLARDVARFEERGVFRAEWVQPVDLFPQTYHVENICLLKRVM